MNYIDTRLEDLAQKDHKSAFAHIYRVGRKSKVRYWLLGIIVLLVALLFLPWTQNIRARGSVTTLRQEQRPQELNTIIPGKIAKWHVKEGDFVKAGDTILQLAEIKDDYLDPNLLNRTREQLTAKQMAIENYKGKAGTADLQITALEQARVFKISQIENKMRQQRMKVQSDSMDMLAARNELAIATEQLRRQTILLDSGVSTLTSLEQRNQAFQNSMAKKTSTEIKYLNSMQELGVLQLELNGAVQDYNEKISKASGDKFQSLSNIATGEGEVAKLQNQYMNYDIRSKLYVITAPQDGQVIRAKKAGIGEIVKDGEMLVEIVPNRMDYAVEIFVRPLDLPLLSRGQKVRFMFDGFPAIVFSGWPAASYGTFGGVVAAVENSVNENGMFRVLVAEDKADRPWPPLLRMGAGAQGMALLKDVPVWYELWRNINGFPPEYYANKTESAYDAKKKDKK